MRYSFWLVFFLAFGLAGIAFVIMFEFLTVNDQNDYYMLKEAMEASMIEAIDVRYYRSRNNENPENIKIVEQKFVENFTRRFVAIMGGDATEYTVDFYDVMESPPKASIIISSKTKKYSIMLSKDKNDFTIKNNLTGILEFKTNSSNDTSAGTTSKLDNNSGISDSFNGFVSKNADDEDDSESIDINSDDVVSDSSDGDLVSGESDDSSLIEETGKTNEG